MLEDYFRDQVYLLSTATLLLAVIIALYFANFLKDENDNEDNQIQNMENNENETPRSDEYNRLHEGSNDFLNEDVDSNDDDYLQTDAGILGKLKSARWKSLEAQLTEDQLEEERRIEREQLAAIFELLKKQESELNFKEIDENELNAQLNLYR